MLLGTPSDLGVGLPLLRRDVGNEHTRVHFHRSLLACGHRGPWSQESLRNQRLLLRPRNGAVSVVTRRRLLWTSSDPGSELALASMGKRHSEWEPARVLQSRESASAGSSSRAPN